jgi:hypothetical protein
VKSSGLAKDNTMDHTMAIALLAYFLSWALVLAITLFSR